MRRMIRLWCSPAPHSCRRNRDFILPSCWAMPDSRNWTSLSLRETREHREHVAETISREGSRHSWKFGGDALLTHIYNFFPSTFGGEYIFDPIKVDPFTFQPMIGGLELTPLRAYAHQMPHYYVQSLGTAVSHPDSNEYSAFAQDTIRATNHF